MDEIYEVERDQYAGLIGEMKTSCFHMDTSYQEDKTINFIGNVEGNRALSGDTDVIVARSLFLTTYFHNLKDPYSPLS